MKRLSMLLIVAFLIAGIMIGCSAEEPVYFPDTNLRATIREAIGWPTGDIYPSDLAELTELYAAYKDISDITGLEQCTSLEYLELYLNQISDISPVANLTSLTHLYLHNNQISDISPTVNLTRLRSIYLDSNQIIDIVPLVENEELGEGDKVSLNDNPLSDDSINIYIPQLKARGVTVDY